METTDTAAAPILAASVQDDHHIPAPSPRRLQRHTKGLSLNFPILLPTHTSESSPSRAGSPSSASGRSSPHVKAASIATPHETLPSPSRTSTDFLTMVAAQERKVLELKEELVKAESELTHLKRQWAHYETNKKRDEIKQIKKLPVRLDDVTSPREVNEEELEEQNRRKKALIEMHQNVASNVNTSDTAKLARSGSKRKVFDGRQARTLSLLGPTSPAKRSLDQMGSPIVEALDEAGNQATTDSLEEHQRLAYKPSLSRMPTLDGLVSPDTLQSSFGKTYRDLALNRRSLPPGTAEMFKQGKQVVDGVKEGLWTFLEDMRQVTMGDEAIYGPTEQQEKRLNGRRNSNKPVRTKSRSSHLAQKDGSDEPSFWKEFGLDTPQRRSTMNKEPELKHEAARCDRHAQRNRDSDSSTNSQRPPELLEDLHGNDDGGDDWDHWESSSPVLTKDVTHTTAVNIPPHVDDEVAQPWSELQKETPSKLSRPAGDLLQEWDTSENATIH